MCVTGLDERKQSGFLAYRPLEWVWLPMVGLALYSSFTSTYISEGHQNLVLQKESVFLQRKFLYFVDTCS